MHLKKRPRHSVWPDPLEVLFLKAATSHREEALESWLRYCRKEPAWGNKRDAKLFPTVFFRLSRIHGLTDFPYYERLKDIYRATFVANRCLFERAIPSLAALEKFGIEVCLLKGSALVSEFYRDLGARAMTDVDALVAEGQIQAAGLKLKSLGWRNKTDRPLETFDPRKRHSIDFLGEGDTSIDLHCHILHLDLSENSSLCFLNRKKIEIAGHTLGTMCAADHLLHVCVHGMGISSGQTVRWIADVMQILTTPGFDWDRLIAISAEKRLSPFLSEVLDYLRKTFAVDVPDNVLADLKAERVSFFDRSFCRLHRPYLSRVQFQLYNFLRIYRNGGSRRFFPSFWLYLRQTWEKIFLLFRPAL